MKEACEWHCSNERVIAVIHILIIEYVNKQTNANLKTTLIFVQLFLFLSIFALCSIHSFISLCRFLFHILWTYLNQTHQSSFDSIFSKFRIIYHTDAHSCMQENVAIIVLLHLHSRNLRDIQPKSRSNKRMCVYNVYALHSAIISLQWPVVLLDFDQYHHANDIQCSHSLVLVFFRFDHWSKKYTFENDI